MINQWQAGILIVASMLATIVIDSHQSQNITVAESRYGRRSLFIVEKSSDVDTFKANYTQLIDIIQKLNYKVTVKGADDATLKISKYGEYIYTSILLFCPSVTSLKGNVYVKDIVEYINNGGNLLLVLNNNPGNFLKQLAMEVGIQPKVGGPVKEFRNIKFRLIAPVTGDESVYPTKQISYKGVQYKMIKSEMTNEILTNVAVDDTRPNEASKFVNNVLVSIMQARNNARVVVSGSGEFLSDEKMSDSKIANNMLVSNLIHWVMKEKSLLRCSDVQHRKLNQDPTPSTDISRITNYQGYTINDDIEYSIKIEIYQNNQWKPYTGDDVQLEFVRIDPFVRKTMVIENDRHVARFKVPDVYGVYKFLVDYKSDGLTYIHNETLVSVRPLRHNEYERYIYSAFPYYLSAFLMMVYLYMFSFVYLYQKKDLQQVKHKPVEDDSQAETSAVPPVSSTSKKNKIKVKKL